MDSVQCLGLESSSQSTINSRQCVSANTIMEWKFHFINWSAASSKWRIFMQILGTKITCCYKKS